MFFTLAKLFSYVASPSHFGLILLIAGTVLLFAGYHRAARWTLLPVAIGALSLFGPIQLLAQPLENRFPPRPTLCKIDGIILLGGGEDPKLARQRNQPVLREHAGKYFEALDLLHRFADARLVVAAGSGSWDPEGTHETDVSSVLFVQAGIAPERLIFESQSRDTFENFQYAKAIVVPKAGERWVLLTDAMHMPRAVAIARTVDFPVIPWPTDYRTQPTGWTFANDLNWSAGTLDAAFHEWVGLAAYGLTGRLTNLLPVPQPIDGGCP